MMNYGYEYGHTGFGGEIFMILFWILVIAGIFALVTYGLNNNKSSSSGSKTALTILEERYARGEIDTNEFESRKASLQK